MNKLFAVTAALLLLHGCASDDDSEQLEDAVHDGASGDTPDAMMAEMPDAMPDAMPDETDMELPPLEPGFERFETAPVEVEAGTSNDWAQWVGGPLDRDYDVVAIQGLQTAGGHHALMYATTEEQAAGFTRLWQDTDQFSTRLMGGVGGEGGANSMLPDGVVFRVKKGSYLMVQTHYLNTSEETIMARSVLDVKLEPVDTSRRVASILSSFDPAVTLAPGLETAMDIDCEVQEDLQFLQISNHMHEYGVSTFTEVIEPSGERRMLKDDSSWSYEWALNPNFDNFTVEDPLFVAAGSTLRTHCEWNNTTTEEITFPTEMCVFFGFILGNSDINCNAGTWVDRGAIESE